MSLVRAASRVRVELSAVSISNEAAACLASVRIRRELSAPAQCELVFHAPTPLSEETSDLFPGTQMAVYLEGRTGALFEGEITAVEYEISASRSREVRVRGYDVLDQLRRKQSAKVFTKLTPEDLASELVADLGIAVQPEASGVRSRISVQHRQTDWDLLVESAERVGLYLNLHEHELEILTLEGKGPPISLALGEEILEGKVEINHAGARQSVQAAGWEPLQGKEYRGRATTPRNADVSDELKLLLAEGTGADYSLFGEIFESDEEATLVAQGELDRATAKRSAFSGVVEGNPDLRPGSQVDVEGVAPLMTRFVLTSVAHTIDSNLGFLTEINSAPPPRRRKSGGVSLTKGIVTHVDDPDGLGRVRAELPSYGDVETDWMPLVVPGVGRGKGFVMVPDVGDAVMILCPGGDPGQGVVLGGLFGELAPPESGVVGQRVRRSTLATSEGHRLTLDDESKSLRLQDAKGSYVELSPNLMKLHSEVELVIEAPGKPIIIAGDNIDFRRT